MDTGLVFGIIFAAIVIILLMVFGFRYINEVFFISCESQTGQQIVNLENAVKSTLTLSQGASQNLKIIIPNCLERMCFVDPDHPEVENIGGGWSPDEFTATLVSRYGYNVVLVKSNGEIDGRQIDKFRPYVNFCITSSKEVTLRNIGTLVEITLPGF
jgi:hypothetical protein